MSIDVSIVIANFNKSKTIARAIRSCLNQVLIRKKLELIIIDDASTDNSIKNINEFLDNPLVRFIQLKKNMGIGYVSNLGIKKSRGKYWIRVDSDDYIAQLTIEYLINILESNKNLQFAVCDILKFNSNNTKFGVINRGDVENLFKFGAGILYRKNIFSKVGFYNSKLRNGEDFELMSKLFKNKYSWFHLPIPLYRYYIQSNSLTLSNSRINVINN